MKIMNFASIFLLSTNAFFIPLKRSVRSKLKFELQWYMIYHISFVKLWYYWHDFGIQNEKFCHRHLQTVTNRFLSATLSTKILNVWYGLKFKGFHCIHSKLNHLFRVQHLDLPEIWICNSRWMLWINYTDIMVET